MAKKRKRQKGLPNDRDWWLARGLGRIGHVEVARAIERELGVTVSRETVRQRADLLGIRLSEALKREVMSRRLRDYYARKHRQRDEHIRALYRRKRSISAIARELELDSRTVARVVTSPAPG